MNIEKEFRVEASPDNECKSVKEYKGRYEKLSVEVLEKYPEPDLEVIHKHFLEEYQDFNRKIVVLDDDPTGVQTVHDISVYTDWTEESLKDGMEEDKNIFYVLTNSRSFSAHKTEQEHRIFASRIYKVAKELGSEVLLISRGDSTLRGHYPLETDVLREEIEALTNKKINGQIICPYFKEGGRFTIDSVHYLKEGEWLIPVGQSEFGKDKTFGYRSSHLGDYVEEKSEGRYLSEDSICITLALLRNQKYDEITELLCSAEDYTPILVDAIAECDVEVFGTCLLRAIKQGKEFLIRSAAALPKVMGNISNRGLLTKEELTNETQKHENSLPQYGGIVLIGSHVRKTTMQLEELKKSNIPMEFLEFHVNSCFVEGGLQAETVNMIQEVEKVMKTGKTAVVYTSRTLVAPEGVDKEELLRMSVGISDAVTAVIAGLHHKPKFLIAKGGITSSDVGTKALQVKKALVLGQIAPGIPVWRIGPESKFPGLSYIIFPGNVGEVDALRKIVTQLAGTRKAGL